ncbi:hypothetical protein HaLaN_25143, partial [Haematococcus lacustris]
MSRAPLRHSHAEGRTNVHCAFLYQMTCLASRSLQPRQATRCSKSRKSVLLLRAHLKSTSSEARTAPSVPRDVMAAASSASFLPVQQHVSAGSWLEAVVRLAFPQNTSHVTEEDMEWVREFGQYLDPAEELGHKHSMYVSHLAERLATEPPRTQR